MTQLYFCGYSYHNHRDYTQHEPLFPRYLFRLQTEGKCKAVVNGQKIDVVPGNLLLIKPGDEYELIIQESQTSGDYHLACEGPWIHNWWNRLPKNQVSQIDIDENLLGLWRQLIVENRRIFSTEKNEMIDYLLRVLCLYIERAVNETLTAKVHPYASRMMRYIEQNATSALKIEDVARYANLSASRASHLFKSNFGKTIMEYAMEIRLSSAIDQMKYTTMTLNQIAESCGFGTYPYFHRVFKKKYQLAPGTYRRLN